MRIMGLDFGSKTVGVAISDPLLITELRLSDEKRKINYARHLRVLRN